MTLAHLAITAITLAIGAIGVGSLTHSISRIVGQFLTRAAAIRGPCS